MALIENNIVKVVETLTSLGFVGTNLSYIDEQGNTVTYDLSTIIPVIPSATETLEGTAEIATQAETNTGVDDTRFITPLKLSTFIGTLALGDGNQALITRANSIAGVAPTLAEVPAADLLLGDTASIYLSNGTIEYWSYDGTIWNLVFVTTAQTLSDALVTLTGLAPESTNLGTFSSIITVNTTIKAALQEIVTELETYFVKTASDTNSVDLTIDGAGDLTADVKVSATQDSEFVLTVATDGIILTRQVLPAYVTHALADADAGLLTGDAYVLTIANLEGVPSDGTGPRFIK